MIVQRFPTPGLSQVAYLVADETTGVAAIIDPRRDIEEYLAFAAGHGLQIVAALETHIHADFVSGAREIADTGAIAYAGARAGLAYPHRPLADGDEVAIGRLRLRALWTPGHTPEHVAFLLFDSETSAHPLALFSGDALFVGDVGRPDLLGASTTRDLAAQLFATVRNRLATLPDDLIVYPGHTAGSSCGKQISDAPHTTIGQEKRFNYAFQPTTEAAFVTAVLGGMPAPPPYYPILKRINHAGPPLLRNLPQPAALDPAAFAAAVAAGALPIDTRDRAAFGAGHVPGALAAGLGPNLATWLGWLAPYEIDLLLVLDDAGRVPEALMPMRRIGLDRVSGWLAGGLPAWRASGRQVATLSQVAPVALATDLTTSGAATVVDVRDPAEWARGHIPGAIHRPAGELLRDPSALADLGDGARLLAVVCASGYRSMMVASLLARREPCRVRNVAGGMDAWNAAGMPTTGA